MRAASELLSSQPVDLVLSNTYQSDGIGVGLLNALAPFPVTAFLCLPVDNSCLWLPAIDDGKVCLGQTALRPLEFRRTLEESAQCLPVAPPVSSKSSRLQFKGPHHDTIAVGRTGAAGLELRFATQGNRIMCAHLAHQLRQFKLTEACLTFIG